MSIPFAQLSFPEMYEHSLVTPLFRPFAEQLLEHVGLAPGDRVLDVACGTGIVARLARERLGNSARIVGIDLSPAMLAVARQLAHDIDWREGNAGAPPLHADEQFDVVTCHQGLQFFPDRAAALQQLQRALTRTGRIAIGTWQTDAELPYLLTLRRIAERHVGAIDDRRHSLGDAAELEALLRDAGFRDVRVQTVSRTIHFSDPAVWVRLNGMALIGMSAQGKDLNDAERQDALAAIIRASEEVTRQHTDASGLAFELGSHIATATVGSR